METLREPTVICKPALDHREYCHLRFGPLGELTALLISDPETDKAAAAMDVGVGHSSDPASLLGLAHFCEHMLFLGTDKYPEEGSYQAFVSEHGGACNAFTGYENTNYHFDVQSRAAAPLHCCIAALPHRRTAAPPHCRRTPAPSAPVSTAAPPRPPGRLTLARCPRRSTALRSSSWRRASPSRRRRAAY